MSFLDFFCLEFDGGSVRFSKWTKIKPIDFVSIVRWSKDQCGHTKRGCLIPEDWFETGLFTVDPMQLFDLCTLIAVDPGVKDIMTYCVINDMSVYSKKRC